jgi:F-box/WD-40 domain protein MET30
MQIVGGSEPHQQQQMELDRCAINPCMPDELRKIQLKQHFSIPTAPTQSPPLKKGWKNIYAERYLVENNWRKSRYTSRVLSGHTQTVLCVHAIANRLITGSADWTARVWDIPSGECVLILRG